MKQLSFWGGASLAKTVVVFIGGKAGVGKTTSAEIMQVLLADRRYNAKIMPLAQAVKECARDYFHWDGKKDTAGRWLLQQLGTHVGRIYNQNNWTKTLDEKIRSEPIPPDFVLVDDWRFPNEREYFERDAGFYQVVSIRIEAPEREILKGTEAYNDLSEVSLPVGDLSGDSYYDFVIPNSGSFAELEENLENVLNILLRKEVLII